MRQLIKAAETTSVDGEERLRRSLQVRVPLVGRWVQPLFFGSPHPQYRCLCVHSRAGHSKALTLATRCPTVPRPFRCSKASSLVWTGRNSESVYSGYVGLEVSKAWGSCPVVSCEVFFVLGYDLLMQREALHRIYHCIPPMDCTPSSQIKSLTIV